MEVYTDAIELRNNEWKKNPNIPKWVDINAGGLDQVFTLPQIAETYYLQLIKFLIERNIDIDNCIFIEPSAGSGSFFNLLPANQRIGIDMYPRFEAIIQQDFLSWKMPIEYINKTKVFIGSPPFGYRGWLALAFLNHASAFADYIAFILPMTFQSDGKDSPKNRVTGMKLSHSEIVPSDSFFNYPLKRIEKISTLWQIWEKGENIRTEKQNYDEWLDIFQFDSRKDELLKMSKIKTADVFLQKVFYKNPPILVENFSEVDYSCGYGLIFKKEKEYLKEIFNNVDWIHNSYLAPFNRRHHISLYHIERILKNSNIIKKSSV
jgi:hypothetical protein